MTVVAIVVVLRSAVLVFWEQAHFDADQAVIGLMAKHLAEGRAFPMFLYGQNYIFAVEAWMAAAVFLVTGASVAALKFPLLVINVVVALLLIRLFEREAKLRPLYGAAAAIFFVLPPPGTATTLVQASGVNLEPFLYVLLLWMTRRRPALCGVIFAIGFLQREFTAYGVIALLAIGAIDGVLFTREGLRRIGAAARTAIEVYLVVTVLKPLSTPAGPHTSMADIHAPANNVRELLGRFCFDPAATLPGIGSLLTIHWMQLFGLERDPLGDFSIESRVTQGVRGLWIVLAAAMLISIVRVVRATAAEARATGAARPRLRREHYFPAYVLLVGLLSAAAFVMGRCGAVGPMRYVLLSIYAAVGVAAWHLQVERSPRVRRTWMGLVAVWALVSAVAHERLLSEYLRHPPTGPKRVVIRTLEQRGVRYGIADYWDAYYISFLTKERIIMKAENFPRIYDYDRQVEAHMNEAVRVSRTPCAGGEGVVYGFWLCPP